MEEGGKEEEEEEEEGGGGRYRKEGLINFFFPDKSDHTPHYVVYVL